MSIDEKLNKIRDLAQSGNEEDAFAQINELINLYPHDAEVWSLRSTLHATTRKYEEALNDVTKSIEFCPEVSTFYFKRGRYNFKLGRTIDAITDFSDALVKYKGDDITYKQHLYFHRAESFVKLGKKQEAFADIEHIPDGFQIWTFALRSKADLIADCDKV